MKRNGHSHRRPANPWIIVLILFLTIVVAFMGRLSTSVALVEIGNELVWSQAQKGFLGGLLMGIFLVSYGFSNVFFSPGIDKYGSRNILLCSIIGCSFAVFIGAFFGHIYSMFIFSRLLLGLSQGVLFPIAAKLVAGWFTARDRSKANSIFIIGASAGVALAPIILGPLMRVHGWRMAFYMLAVLGIILTAPILLFVKDTPQGRLVTRHKLDMRDVFSRQFKEKEFKQVTVGFTAVNTIWWGSTLWVPTYLASVHGFDVSRTPYLAAIPYLGAIAGLITGTRISDGLNNPNTVIRVSLLMTGTMIVVLTQAPVNSLGMAILLLVLFFFFGQMAPPLFFTKLQNSVKGEELGSATGLMNGISNTFAVLGPLSVGTVVAMTGSYNYGLMALAIIAFAGLAWFSKLL